MDEQNNTSPSSRLDRVLQALKRDYLIIGNGHIKAWQAWLVLGLVVGMAAGIILVANRSGEVETGKAQQAGAPALPPGMQLCGPNPLRQFLCSDTANVFMGYGKELGFQWNGSGHTFVNLCYGSGCSAPRCSGTNTCVPVSPSFFTERAKYQGAAIFSGKGTGLYAGMKAASPYYRAFDYSRITTINNNAGAPNFDNNTSEKYYFHYDPTSLSNPGPGCPQKDPRWDPNEVAVCATYNGSPGEHWVCSKRFRVAELSIAGILNPGAEHESNYAEPGFAKELVARLILDALSPDPYTGEKTDGFHFDTSWIGEQWQFFGALDDPPMTPNSIQPCEAPSRQDKVNGFISTLQKIRQELDAAGYTNVIIETNMTQWDSVHRDLLGKLAPRGSPARSWTDWTELIYAPPGSPATTDFLDGVTMDVYSVFPTGIFPGVPDVKISGKEWVDLVDHFLTQTERGKFAGVLAAVGSPLNSPKDLESRLWSFSSYLMWKGKISSWAPFNFPFLFKLPLPVLSGYKFETAPGTLNGLTPELLMAPGKPLDTASTYNNSANTGGVQSLWRNRGEKWGSCATSQQNCPVVEVDPSSLVGAYGRRFENEFVVVNNDALRSAKINFPANSIYRYKMEFTGNAFLQTDGIWNKGKTASGEDMPCYYKGTPINSLTLKPRSAAIIITSGSTVNCP